MNEATPTAKGSSTMSSSTTAHTRTTSSQKGKIRTFGCHGSYNSSLPSVQASPAVTTWEVNAAVAPPMRNVTNPTAHTMAMPSNAIAVAMPLDPPNTRTGNATRSKSRGPGWLTSMPALTDADDHVPSSG